MFSKKLFASMLVMSCAILNPAQHIQQRHRRPHPQVNTRPTTLMQHQRSRSMGSVDQAILYEAFLYELYHLRSPAHRQHQTQSPVHHNSTQQRSIQGQQASIPSQLDEWSDGECCCACLATMCCAIILGVKNCYR